MSELEWDIYFWIGEESTVRILFPSFPSHFLVFNKSLHFPPLFFSLPSPPLPSSSFSLPRWIRRHVLPCTLFIFVICWVVNDVHTEKKWVMNQINLLNYSLRSHTLKVYRSCNVSCDVSCDDHVTVMQVDLKVVSLLLKKR